MKTIYLKAFCRSLSHYFYLWKIRYSRAKNIKIICYSYGEMKNIIGFIFILAGIIFALPFQAQVKVEPKPPLTRILFVFDASNSMSGLWESDVKMNIARRILISMVDSLEQLENVQMALRVYGHQSPVPPQDCNDTRLEVAFSANNASVIRQRLRFISPKGTTPIANSLFQCQNDFPECDNCRNIVILISDGIEACEGDPCAVSEELQKKGIVLKPFIIGIGIDEGFKATFDCIGHYFNANREEKFKELLNIVISQALNSTTAQVNLLDENGLPTESNVNMTFYDRYSGKVLQNYVHTMNHRGNPDTLVLDPLVTYKIIVQTTPPVYIDSFKVVPGIHSVAAVSAPQGYLSINSPGLGNLYRDMFVIVRKAGENNTLTYQRIGDVSKYLKGLYDVEIPVLPRILATNVEIKQSSTTTLEIPRPGILTIMTSSYGFGSLYLRNSEGLQWIYNLRTNQKSETIVLQPGTYTVVFRAQGSKQSIYTVNRNFEIKSGASLALELY